MCNDYRLTDLIERWKDVIFDIIREQILAKFIIYLNDCSDNEILQRNIYKGDPKITHCEDGTALNIAFIRVLVL